MEFGGYLIHPKSTRRYKRRYRELPTFFSLRKGGYCKNFPCLPSQRILVHAKVGITHFFYSNGFGKHGTNRSIPKKCQKMQLCINIASIRSKVLLSHGKKDITGFFGFGTLSCSGESLNALIHKTKICRNWINRFSETLLPSENKHRRSGTS